MTTCEKTKYMILKVSKYSNILSASLPTIKPSYAVATAPVFLPNQGNRIGFTKLLFQRTFIHCAIVLPFILC